jgi:hypothetical protein
MISPNPMPPYQFGFGSNPQALLGSPNYFQPDGLMGFDHGATVGVIFD